MQLASREPRADWLCAVDDAFQILTTGLSSNALSNGGAVMESFRLAAEPINDTERLIFRCFVSELLLHLLYFSERIVYNSYVERILSAWPSIQSDPQPVSVLRQALERHRAGSPSDVRLAQQVKSLLEEHYAGKIVTRRLAVQLGVSESRMNRCFRLVFGTTVHHHLMCVRVKQGLELVARGVKIEAAGLAVGFRSKKDFYRAVRQLMGCTPAQFRGKSWRDAAPS
jgi:AraC-like DNA-binding protein